MLQGEHAGKRGVITTDKRDEVPYKVTFADGTEIGYLKPGHLRSSGLDETAFFQRAMAASAAAVRAACDAQLSEALRDALRALRARALARGRDVNELWASCERVVGELWESCGRVARESRESCGRAGGERKRAFTLATETQKLAESTRIWRGAGELRGSCGRANNTKEPLHLRPRVMGAWWESAQREFTSAATT